MEFRRCSPDDDMRQIGRVYAESWKHAYRGLLPPSYLASIHEGCWTDALERDRERTLLALERGIPVGVARYGAAREKAYQGVGELFSLYVLPGKTRQGVGTRLFAEVRQALLVLGYPEVYLWVLEENWPARRFYELNGLYLSGESKTELFDGQPARLVQYVAVSNRED